MGAWVAQLVGYPTLTQLMISGFVGSSPTSGSVLTARSLLRILSLSLSLSLPSPLPYSLSLSLKINNK